MSKCGKPIVKQPSRLATLGPCSMVAWQASFGAPTRRKPYSLQWPRRAPLRAPSDRHVREERRPMKRSLLFLLALALSAGTALALGAGTAFAQDKWPSQPIRIINAFAAGGATDITLRTAAEELRDILGVNVIVENKPGAGGIIAIEDVSRKP